MEKDRVPQTALHIEWTVPVADVSTDQPYAVAENLRRLNVAGSVGRHLVPVYLAAIEESDAARDTAIFTIGGDYSKGLAKNTGGFYIQSKFTDVHDTVYIVAKSGWGHFRQAIKNRPKMTEMMADSLDIPVAEFDEKKFAEFTMAHELGHADDYSKFSIEEGQQRRVKDMISLPVAFQPPSALIRYLKTPAGLRYWLENKKFYKQQGINTLEELREAQEVAYRSCETEAAADRFAVRVLRRLQN